MNASFHDLYPVLKRFNPWWDGGQTMGLPPVRRSAFSELFGWVQDPPARRAVLLSGARQTGKTTLFLQVIQSLLDEGVAPERILYTTFDHPLLRLTGLERTLETWREFQSVSGGTEYLFLDEIQQSEDWQIWLKHQVDFEPNRRIAITGSATPLATENQESGVGRWYTIKLPTLSFAEFLQLTQVPIPPLPEVASLSQLFSWSPTEYQRVAENSRPLIQHFHEYLLKGGFPQTALIENVVKAQQLLREDIIDKALKRDMTSLFGVRRVHEIEQLFLYLCLHDGGILDMTALCSSLSVQKPTAKRYIDFLESTHLIYKLPPFGYGKEVLRGRNKVLLADSALSGSVLLKGRSLLEDPVRLGAAVEAVIYKHVFTHYYRECSGFSYWRGRGGHEVDVITEIGGEPVPFEVKYQTGDVDIRDLTGLRMFCEKHHPARAYVITRELTDFGLLPDIGSSKVFRIPAVLACYWLSAFPLD